MIQQDCCFPESLWGGRGLTEAISGDSAQQPCFLTLSQYSDYTGGDLWFCAQYSGWFFFIAVAIPA